MNFKDNTTQESIIVITIIDTATTVDRIADIANDSYIRHSDQHE